MIEQNNLSGPTQTGPVPLELEMENNSRKWLWIGLAVAAILILAAVGSWMWLSAQDDQDNNPEQTNNSSQNSTNPTVTPTVTPTISGDNDGQSSDGSSSSSPVTQEVKLYLVAVGDTTAPSFGCGDHLQSVQKTLTTARPLTDSLKALLAIKDEHYGQSGLYNSLYASDLTVDSASIVGGKATIKLTGNLKLSGECDNPRVKEQLEATAKQFNSVKTVEITLNGQSLDQALSLK